MQESKPRARRACCAELDLKATFAEVLADPQAHKSDAALRHARRGACGVCQGAACPPSRSATAPGAPTSTTAAHAQMQQACDMPMAVGAALMPDAHVGYGLPIGGVLALEERGHPVRRRRRHRLPHEALGARHAASGRSPISSSFHCYRDALEKGTRFGVGSEHQTPQAARRDGRGLDRQPHHAREQRQGLAAARHQRLGQPLRRVRRADARTTDADELGLEAGQYVALLSATAAAAAPARRFAARTARSPAPRLPKRYEQLGRLAWLDMDTQAGQEYWAAMNLMGDYAAANHAVIHRIVAKLLGSRSDRRRREPSQLRLEGAPRRRRRLRASQGRHARRRGRAGRDPRLDGRSRRSSSAARATPRACNSASHGAGRRMSRNAGQGQVQLPRRAEGPRSAGHQRAVRRQPTKCPASTRTSTP